MKPACDEKLVLVLILKAESRAVIWYRALFKSVLMRIAADLNSWDWVLSESVLTCSDLTIGKVSKVSKAKVVVGVEGKHQEQFLAFSFYELANIIGI